MGLDLKKLEKHTDDLFIISAPITGAWYLQLRPPASRSLVHSAPMSLGNLLAGSLAGADPEPEIQALDARFEETASAVFLLWT